jgi:dephospho-CoA kinase
MIVGLTGGLGSGKSSVAAILAERGAVIIDADAIAREVVEPRTPGFEAVVARFGPGVVGVDGALDRPRLADVVFADADALADLNAIVHPLVGQRSAELIAAAPKDSIIVYDIPLLVESGLASGFDFVVVVSSAMEVRLARLAERGLPQEQARARIKAQTRDEQRRAVADEVIGNDGSRDELRAAVDALWLRLETLARSPGRAR